MMIMISWNQTLWMCAFAYITIATLAFFSNIKNDKQWTNYFLARKLFALSTALTATYISSLCIFSNLSEHPVLLTWINLSFFFLAANLAKAMLHLLLSPSQDIRILVQRSLSRWIVFNALATIFYFGDFIAFDPYIQLSLRGLCVLEYTYLICSFIKHYLYLKRSASQIDSDERFTFFRCMPFCYSSIVLLGISGLFQSLQNRIVLTCFLVISILLSLIILISLQNYIIILQVVKNKRNNPKECEEKEIIPREMEIIPEPENKEVHKDPKKIELENALADWVEKKKYTQQKVTLENLAEDIHSNRTYVSNYINQAYNLTYRDWIAQHRLNYAKELLISHPEMTITKISETVGYNRSSFITVFTKHHNISPSLWREKNISKKH